MSWKDEGSEWYREGGRKSSEVFNGLLSLVWFFSLSLYLPRSDLLHAPSYHNPLRL